MAERKVVPFDEFYYQLKLMHLPISETPCTYEIRIKRKGFVFELFQF
jgi:hypothetical protein